MGTAHRALAGRLLSNGLWNALSTGVSGVVAFLLVPHLLRELGVGVFGVWVLIGSVFAYTTILQMGLQSAVNRHIPVALARGDEDEVRRIMSTATLFFGAVGALILVLTIALASALPLWVQVDRTLVPVARRAVWIVGGLLALSVSGQAVGAALSGYQRYDMLAVSRLVMVLVRATLIWGLVTGPSHLLTVAWISATSELGVVLIQGTMAARLLPSRPLAWCHVHTPLLREMLTYGSSTFLYSAGAVIAYKTAEVVLGAVDGPDSVAVYSVAATGVLTLSALVEALSAALKPAVSALDAEAAVGAIRDLSLAFQKFSLLLILPATAFLVLLGDVFIALWTGAPNPAMATTMAMLAVGQGVRLSQQSNFLVLVGKGEHRVFGFCTLIAGVLTATGTLLAVAVWRTGLTGAAIASAGAWIVIAGVVLPRHVNRQLRITSAERRQRVWVPALAGSAPAIAVMLMWRSQHVPSSWAELLGVLLLATVATATASWLFTLAPPERRRLRLLLVRHA